MRHVQETPRAVVKAGCGDGVVAEPAGVAAMESPAQVHRDTRPPSWGRGDTRCVVALHASIAGRWLALERHGEQLRVRKLHVESDLLPRNRAKREPLAIAPRGGTRDEIPEDRVGVGQLESRYGLPSGVEERHLDESNDARDDVELQPHVAAGSTARHVQGHGGDRRNRRAVLAQPLVRTVDGDEAWAQGQG